MTQIQWQQLEAAIASMTDSERLQLASLLVQAPAAGPSSANPSNPSLGLFADEPELIDEIMDYVYAARENHPLRAEQ